ncbi:MAG: polyprenyl synthetase family protein [Acidobacteria bacterium]|nr:polyprenyl synthetase family protein [Acidobacteriota bacterium]NIO59964.1 polyprenyl synthetase family protein [Acidobacteriota bacterium]NIQ31036.1 polyprenyl synthetase family protein [Acidobacteriota bacterium]NIQ86164.1 polyprenyl synthetase family protein [Acidobacteriota bacterium]NIT11660.1 polyprenyl synthetase family protein [Acidobacteriota bacterium]
MNLDVYLSQRRAEVERALERFLPTPEGPGATITRAMRYAVQAGGKRLRPILALTACDVCGGSSSAVQAPAVALELIHTYSLIHDDLPAMDDDDLRRGKPTVHKAFGEAEAILAGDALNTLAFELLANHPEGELYATRRTRAVSLVARRSGIDGMVGGQIADLEAENGAADEQRLHWIHRHKTAALLSASSELGAIHAGADDGACAAFSDYGRQLGLAFQIADDILDCTSTATDLGKTPGKDRHVGKLTFPALYGIDGSRERALDAVQRALESLERVGALDERLEALARFSVERAG